MLLALLGAATSGYLVEDDSPTEAAQPTAPARRPAATATAVTSTALAAPAAATTQAHAAAALVVVRAARGDCWVEAREGSARGPVLFAGLLAQGDTQRFRAALVWLRLGAGTNVDVTVGGRRASVPAGTGELVVRADA